MSQHEDNQSNKVVGGDKSSAIRHTTPKKSSFDMNESRMENVVRSSSVYYYIQFNSFFFFVCVCVCFHTYHSRFPLIACVFLFSHVVFPNQNKQFIGISGMIGAGKTT